MDNIVLDTNVLVMSLSSKNRYRYIWQSFVDGRFTLCITNGSTAVMCIFLNLIMCDQYLSIIIASSMYKDAYLDNGYEPKLLSRTIEDSATVTSPIIPWTTCGMTQANVLGVSTLTYAPYCIFNYLSPVVTVLMALRVKKSK